MEPNEHDLRCACKTELGQLRNRLEALGNRIARYDANYDAMPYHRAPEPMPYNRAPQPMPYHRAPDPIHVPGGGAAGDLGAPGGLDV